MLLHRRENACGDSCLRRRGMLALRNRHLNDEHWMTDCCRPCRWNVRQGQGIQSIDMSRSNPQWLIRAKFPGIHRSDAIKWDWMGLGRA